MLCYAPNLAMRYDTFCIDGFVFQKPGVWYTHYFNESSDSHGDHLIKRQIEIEAGGHHGRQAQDFPGKVDQYEVEPCAGLCRLRREMVLDVSFIASLWWANAVMLWGIINYYLNDKS